MSRQILKMIQYVMMNELRGGKEDWSCPDAESERLTLHFNSQYECAAYIRNYFKGEDRMTLLSQVKTARSRYKGYEQMRLARAAFENEVEQIRKKIYPLTYAKRLQY